MRGKENLNSMNNIVDTFGELECDKMTKTHSSKPAVTPIHSDEWTLVSAFSTIYDHLPKSRFNHDLFVRCAEAFSYLNERLGFNPVQCSIIALLVEAGKPTSIVKMARTLGLSRLAMMTHYNTIEELFEKRWLLHRGTEEPGEMCEGYALVPGVIGAIRDNQTFVPEDLKCADTQEFVERLALQMTRYYNDENAKFRDEKVWITNLINENKELPICQLALNLNDINSMHLLMICIADYYNFNGSEDEGINLRNVRLAYYHESVRSFNKIAAKMRKGQHLLFDENLIEHKTEDGITNINRYVATDHLKNEVLSDLVAPNHANDEAPQMNGLKQHTDITPKQLFYNKAEEQQVTRLTSLLSKEQFPLVQQRLNDKGMRTGVCILLHGEPGTGKTATAYELARQTGRNIITVQVTDFKDKYVGESESKLKAVFDNYRTCCKQSEVAPILLLNEGDAILSKRITNVERSVDQMNNSLQNILLEEMENLNGIMIVTTNLTTNLDSAFERRFIYKIQFDKPGKEVKARIWKSMIDELNDYDSNLLAEMFDVSGGEIENIARKATMEYVLTGIKPDFEMLKSFAAEEKLKTTSRPIIGFQR